MDTFLAITAVVCGIVGILGAVLPILPGTMVSFVGMFCAYFTSDSEITPSQMWLWGIISAIIILLDYILPGYFSKVFGGTKAGITGATIGVIVGLFMGSIGIIAGPFIGAVAGEMMSQQKQPLDKALVVGFGSLLSFFVGSGMKLIAGGFMMYYIWCDIF